MPDTFPDLTAFPGSSTIANLEGDTDQYTGLVYIAENVGPDTSPSFGEQFDRDKLRLCEILRVVAAGMFWRESYPGLDYGVFPVDYTLGGTHKHFAGATAQTLTDNATNYIYLNSSNALTVSTSSFPADITTFYRIATVVTLNGDVASWTDDRGYNRNIVPQTTSSSDSGTNNTSFIIDEDNAGAAAASLLVRFNRGSSNAEDAALEWKEADGTIRARSQHSTDTLCPVDASAIYISGTSALTANGAAKVQSAVAGNGLQHSSGVLSVKTASASGTSIGGSGEIAVDPSDGIALDANGVAVNLTANGGLQLTGSSGSKTLGVYTDGTTTGLTAGGAVEVKDGGLTGKKFANQSTASATPGTGAIILRAQLVAGNTVAIHNADAPFKYRIIDAWSIAQSADGGTWKLDNGTNDITNAVTVTGADKTRNAPSTIDDAYWEIAASGTLRVVGDGANADVTVFVMVERVA